MRTMYSLLPSYALLLSLGCSSFVELIDKTSPNFELSRKKNYCSKTSFQLITDSPSLNDAYNKISSALSRPKPFDRFALLALLHLYYSPHVASPTSNFVFFSAKKGKWRYMAFDRHSSKLKYPFLVGLDSLSKLYKSRYRLTTLAALIDRHHSSLPGLSEQSTLFIQKNKDKLNKSQHFKHFYKKGDYLLQSKESFKFQRLSAWMKKRIKTKKARPHKKRPHALMPYKNERIKKFNTQCNFDMKPYQNHPFPSPKSPLPGVQFMIEYRNELFIGLLSQGPHLKLISKTPFFEGKEKSPLPHLCALFSKAKPKRPEVILSSTDGLDPGQHLYNLLQHPIEQKKTPQEFDDLLSSPRHLFLYRHPSRLLFESDRASKGELENILSLGLPIFHSMGLSQVVAVKTFDKERLLFADDRHPMGLSCR
ncbi:MAG: hypothetical protein OXB88_09620 [Bacteriovoracales bacterium]|nr:hypothetical protein [Bacteriovoracales bacterium]